MTLVTQQQQAEHNASELFEAPPIRTGSSVRLRRALVAAADFAALAAGAAVSQQILGPELSTRLALAFCAAMWGWMLAAKLYDSRTVTRRRDEFSRIVRSSTRSAMLIGLVAVIGDLSIRAATITTLYLCITGAVLIGREGLRHWFSARRKAGHGMWASVAVATAEDATKLAAAIKIDRSSPHTIVSSVDPTDTSQDGLLTKTLAAARAAQARGVVVVESSLNADVVNPLVRGLLDAGLYIDLVSGMSDIQTERLKVRNLGAGISTWIEPRPRDGWRSHAKRLFDISVAAVGLVIASPIVLAIVIAIKLTSSGPVLFRQERVGRSSKPFKMLKFRSMVVDAEHLKQKLDEDNEGAGPLFKMKADPRVTKVGKFLRKTSLDELPQLINVVKGEMSLVGPRPALQVEMAQWESALYDRLQVSPGITGMWQISGRSSTTFDEYTRLDLYYVHNWSLLVDLTILVKTIPAVLKSDGAY